jgi:hypothetical protein
MDPLPPIVPLHPDPPAITRAQRAAPVSRDGGRNGGGQAGGRRRREGERPAPADESPELQTGPAGPHLLDVIAGDEADARDEKPRPTGGLVDLEA